jgi:hypothetical protein
MGEMYRTAPKADADHLKKNVGLSFPAAVQSEKMALKRSAGA